ncbi:MAG: transposase [Bacilli bacterium]|nr:transposase [Bacilli bacterium]
MGKRQNRYWSKDEKLRIVNRVIVDGLSSRQVSNSENISNGLLNDWIRKYLELGENGLENKRKPGNPLMKYSRRKELSEIEKLEYENMKLRIENERLKKGYMMKGDGSFVMYKK